jgi:hypothetical protein
MKEFIGIARTCGKCSICCYLFDLPELKKPKNKWCQHCKPGNGGCSVHNQQPAEICGAYRCSWLIGELPDDWFPLKSKMVVNPQMVGDAEIVRIVLHHQYPNKWKEEPYHSMIIRIAKDKHVLVTMGSRIVYTNCSKELLHKYEDTICAPVTRALETMHLT